MVMAPQTVVIYHGDCIDGFTSAWAFRTLNPSVEVTYVPAKHGDAPPAVTGAGVYVLDFAYPRPILTRACTKRSAPRASSTSGKTSGALEPP